MSERNPRAGHVEMRFGRIGGLWAGVVAILSSIVVIVLAILFSALFLGLFVAIAVGVLVRAWLPGRSAKPAGRPQVIDAEYTVVETDDAPGRRTKP